jgi:hypothetical protein
MHATSDKTKAGCDLLTIAFYFLLRVGEYTGHGKKDKRRPKQSRACDITFFDAHDNIIPNTARLPNPTYHSEGKYWLRIQ